MNKWRLLFKKHYIPYCHTLLITHQNGHKYYCERIAHAVYQESRHKKPDDDWFTNPKNKGGKYVLEDGVWNMYPDEEPNVCYVDWKDIVDWEPIVTSEGFDKYREYQLKYFKEHPVEMYLPERRSTLTKEFLEWINQPEVQLGIRNWVDGYGYSDAYNWESPDILMEHIYKHAAIKYGGEEVKKKMEDGKL